MPDLALIITQVLLKSQSLFGEQPENILAPVPYADFIKAMIQDLDRLSADLKEDTRNVLLTLARTLETNIIRLMIISSHKDYYAISLKTLTSKESRFKSTIS